MANKIIEIGALGWDHSDPFYPDDLPEDWRLAYYANAHAAVWVPDGVWLGEALPDAAAWREDVGEAFRFVVSLDARHADSPRAPAIGCVLAGLGEQLLGVVAEDAVYRAVMGEGAGPRRLPPERIWRGETGAGGPVGCVSAAQLASPRAIREVLEAFAATTPESRSFLFVDGPLGALDDVQTIARLMGLC